jgi:P4 family phage/plasmid primase-like protien
MNDFLTRHIVKDGGPYNYVLLTPPYGKYRIEEENQEVLQELHTVISRCSESDDDFGLCECHDDTIPEPLYYDLDFSLVEATPIPFEIIRDFVVCCGKVFHEYLVLDPNNMPVAYVMRKPREVEKKNSKWHVGYHVEFPSVTMRAAERSVLYKLLVSRLDTECVFESIRPQLSEHRVNEIVDSRVITKNAIIKYGCNKGGKLRYEVFCTLSLHGETVPVPSMSLPELSEFLSIRRAAWDSTTLPTEFQSIEQLRELKQELNIERRPPVIQNVTPQQQEPPAVVPQVVPTSQRCTSVEYDQLESVKKLLRMLKPERSRLYDLWIQVSLCLHNVNSSDMMFEVWKTWSASGCPDKALNTNFRKMWDGFKFREEGLKMGSLSLWAREDNPKEFAKYKMEELDKRIKRSIEGETSFDISKALRVMYDGIYVCSNIKNRVWYEFRGHSYVEIQEGYTLFINISEELVCEYEKKKASLWAEMILLTNQGRESETKDYEKQIEDIKRLQKKLKDSTFKSKIMVDARTLFYDEEFENKLNESRNLLVFKNGVYDLDRQEFRLGRPEDYMSFTTGIRYVEFDPNNEQVLRVMHILREMHADQENLEFILTMLAAGLHGIKKEQKLDIWTGTGSNGKSIMIDFLSKSLGDYYESPSITMLTRRRQTSSNASPDLAKLKGRRIVSFLEPEYDDTLHTSIIKQFFGNDWIEARPLYREPVRYKPQATGILACNDLPKIPCNDGGTWRRLRVMPFKNKFVHDPKEPHERQIDIRLPEQIDKLAEAFMSILINQYRIFVNEKNSLIREPKDCKDFTDRYQMESDIYLEFVKDNIRNSSNPKDRLSKDAIWEVFRFWCRSNANWVKPNKHELNRQLVQHLGEPKRSVGWVGKKLVNPKDDFGDESDIEG